jgi:O-antigen ligase
MAENIETTSSSGWFDAEIVKENKTFFGGAVFFMLCLIAIFANIAFGGVSAGVLGLLSILTGILVVFRVLDAWQSGELSVSTNPLQLPLLGLLGIGLIQLLPLGAAEVPAGLLANSAPSAALSLDPYATRFAVLKLFIFLIFFAAALRYINTQKRLRQTVVTIIVFASVMAFFGVLQRLASPEFIYGIREVGQAIPFASYVNQHHFAAFLEMSIGLTLGLIFGGGTKKDKLLLLLIAVVLMGIAIIFTGSRGGLLSLFGVIGFLVLLNIFYRSPGGDAAAANEDAGSIRSNPLRRNLILIGGSLLLVFVLLFAVMWLGGGDSVLRGTGIEVNSTDFTTGRTHFWSVTLEIIRNNPILGAGLEAYGAAFTGYDDWNGQLRLEHAHNDYLQIFADAGIFGLICVIVFIVLLFRQSLAVIAATSDDFRRSAAGGALAGCFGIFLHSLFDFPLRTNANMFFFLLLVTVAVARINYPKLYRRRVKKVKK